MADIMTREQLQQVRAWADKKIATGAEPPWSWYQHMKLCEALDAILAGMNATRPMEDLQVSASRRGAGLRLVDSADPQETAPRRLDQQQVQLPM
jgi:hypothetical protein